MSMLCRCALGASSLRLSASTLPSPVPHPTVLLLLSSSFQDHPSADGRLVGWRHRRTRSCSTRAASSGLSPILTASSAQGAPSNRHRRAAAAAAAAATAAAAEAATRHERSAAEAAAAARATPGAGGGAAIGAGAALASAAPAALAAGTAVIIRTARPAAPGTVAIGLGKDASAATRPRATGGASDKRSESGQARHLWRKPLNRGLSSPLSKKK